MRTQTLSNTCFLPVQLEPPMLKGMCSRRRIITSTSPRRPPSPSTTSPKRTPLSRRKKLNEDLHTLSSACFLPVQLENPMLNWMCSRRQIITSTSPRRPTSPSTTSPRRTPPSQRKNIQLLPFPTFPFYILFNHILEYVRVLFLKEESFAHKALVAFNCRLRFNGSIIYYVCKALRNLLSCCLMISNQK